MTKTMEQSIRENVKVFKADQILKETGYKINKCVECGKTVIGYSKFKGFICNQCREKRWSMKAEWSAFEYWLAGKPKGDKKMKVTITDIFKDIYNKKGYKNIRLASKQANVVFDDMTLEEQLEMVYNQVQFSDFVDEVNLIINS